jgi:NTP pyrophosphatase (non-canonical NTP hydrolase)
VSYGPMGLNDYVEEVTAWCKRKGWHEDITSSRPNSAGDLLMLVVTELAEALEEVRDHHGLNEVYYRDTPHCEVCGRGPTEHGVSEADGSADHLFRPSQKPEGVPVELADVLIRIFDIAGRWDIDLEAVVREKMAFNEGRPYKHGGRSI